MFGKMSCKIFLMSVILSMISGLIAGTVVACVDNKTCITKKLKKAFKQLEDKMT